MNHWYKIIGSQSNSPGRVDLQYSLNELSEKSYSIIADLQNIFITSPLNFSQKEQLLFLKYENNFTLVRFQDNFTQVTESRIFERIEVHFFSLSLFQFWHQIGTFLKHNPIRQIKSRESIEFEYEGSKDVGLISFELSLIERIIKCIICGRTFFASAEEFPLPFFLQLLDSNKVFSDLCFSAYQVNDSNFKRKSETNLCILSEQIFTPVNDEDVLIGHFLTEMAETINSFDISVVKNNESYNKRAIWLLQYEYCNVALRKDLIKLTNKDSIRKIEFVFHLCNSLLEEAPFLINNGFREKLISHILSYYHTNKPLLEKVLSFDNKILSKAPVKELGQLMLEENNIERAFTEYLPIKKISNDVFKNAVVEIVKRHDDIHIYNKELFELILENEADYLLLKRLRNLSKEQISAVFSRIKESDFEANRSLFENINEIEYFDLVTNQEELNKANFLRSKILSSEKYSFARLIKFYHSDNNALKNLIFEINANQIEFQKGEIKSYMILFKNEKKEKQLFEKMTDLGFLSFFDRRRLNRMQIQSIRSEYKIVSKRFRYYNILFLLLVITLATTFIYVYTLRQENSTAKKVQNSLSKEKKKFQSSFDSLIYKYRVDTALLRDSLRKVKLK